MVGLLAAAQAVRSAGDALAIDEGREAALLRAAGDGFQIKRTPHFIIAYDTDRDLVDELTGRLEQTYHAVHHFCEMNGIEARGLDRRLEVVFFNHRASYDRYSAGIGFRSAGTYGLYFEPTNRSAFYNAINDPELVQLHAEIVGARSSLDDLSRAVNDIKGSRTQVEIEFADGRRISGPKAEVKRVVAKEIESARDKLHALDARRKACCARINQTVIQHETAHQVLFNAGVHVRGAMNPRWLVEGLACLFETPPGGLGTGMAAINQARLKDIRSTVSSRRNKRRLTSEDFVQAVSDGRLTPPPRLVADPGLFDERGDRGAIHYAAAWAMTHYLQRTKTAELAAYLKVLSRRRPGFRPTPASEVALFEAHFGPLDETFLRRWGGYILNLHYRPVKGDP